MRRLILFLIPLYGMLAHRKVSPTTKFTGIHSYTWVERGCVRVKCLDREHNTMSPQSGLEPGPLDPGTSALPTRALVMLTGYWKLKPLQLNNRTPLNSNMPLCSISHYALKANKQKTYLTCLESPFPSFHGQHTQNTTFLQGNFPETTSVWTTSPWFK